MTQQLRVVDHLEVAAEVRVLVFHRVEAMRTTRDDLLGAHFIERGDVRLRHLLEEILVTHATRGVTGAGLAWSEYPKGHSRTMKHARGGPTCLRPRSSRDPAQPTQ